MSITSQAIQSSHRQALLLLLLVVHPHVYATSAWTSVIEPREESLVFVDLTRLEIKGRMVKIWSLRNEPQAAKLPSGATYISTVDRYEIDCTKFTIRGLQFYAYTESFAGGRAIVANNDPDSTALTPAPSSVGELIIKFTCSNAMPKKSQKK